MPSPRRLLESVQGLLQEAHMIEGGRVDEAGRLLTVDGLVQVAGEKGAREPSARYLCLKTHFPEMTLA